MSPGEALVCAIQAANVALCYELLKEGADVNLRIHRGQTSLIFAAEQGQFEILRLLLTHPNVDIEARDDLARTALHWASIQGHEAIAKELLLCGADPNCYDGRRSTPLFSLHQQAMKLLCGYSLLQGR